jgi:hypothetical protein
MVPSVFIPLAALPLTSNGKVDFRALPAAEDEGSLTDQVGGSPRNATETSLVEHWRQLLRRQSVGIHDNFFHLGGHSLLATQAIWRIAEAFNVTLPVQAIFEAPTIASLAERIVNAQPNLSDSIARRAVGEENGRLLNRIGQLGDRELKELLLRSTSSDLPS